MGVYQVFSHWREIKRPGRSWGLAWFLANEFCIRYYSSHGIVPLVVVREGLGYYGIELNSVECRINDSRQVSYGRMTMGGDVENWRRGSPGDHGLRSMDMCSKKVPTDKIVQQAIAHMAIKPIPRISHLNCRHKRWGKSYEICFEIATILALRNEPDEIEIWNHPFHTEQLLEELDPKSDMKEHLGAFLFIRNGKKLLVAADGRLLDNSGVNLWQRFMSGYNVFYLADLIDEKLS